MKIIKKITNKILLFFVDSNKETKIIFHTLNLVTILGLIIGLMFVPVEFDFSGVIFSICTVMLTFGISFLPYVADYKFKRDQEQALKNKTITNKLIYGILSSFIDTDMNFDMESMVKFTDQNISQSMSYHYQFNKLLPNDHVIYYNVHYLRNHLDDQDYFMENKIKNNTTTYNLNKYTELLDWYDINFNNNEFKIFNTLEVQDNLEFIKNNLNFLLKDIAVSNDEKELLRLCTEIKNYLITTAKNYIKNQNSDQFNQVNEMLNEQKDMKNFVMNNHTNLYKARELVKNNELIRARQVVSTEKIIEENV